LRQGDTLISLKTTRKQYASQLLEEYQAKRLGIYRVPHKRVSDFFEPYLTHCKKYNKASTIDDKKRTLGYFQEHAGDPWLRQINKKTITNYLDSRIGSRSKSPISTERFNSERQILNNFFNYLIKEKVFRENPATDIEKKKIVKSKKPKSLSRADEGIFDAWLKGERADLEIEGGKLKGISLEARQELITVKTVAIHTGLRAAELTNLCWPDADFERPSLAVTQKPDWKPKDYEERVVPLNRLAVSALREHKFRRVIMGKYIFCRQDGRKYGRGLGLLMCRAFKLAGLGSGGLHTLRHTFATRYLDASGNLKDLQKLLGHSDLKTTQRYLHADEDQMKKTVERMGI
jgi:site-specific recombinase XerD